MNNIYKVIWSKAKNCYVVASEIAKSHTKSASGSEKMGGYGKRAFLALAAASAIFCGGLVNVGASVQSETISPTGTTSNPVLTVDNPDDAAQLNTVISAAKADKLVTKDNIGGQLTDYAKASDLSAKADANDVYSKTAAEDKFATKTELGSYAKSADVYSQTDADGKFATNDALNDLKDTVNGKADKSYVDTEVGKKANKVTTLGGYGITDAYTKGEVYKKDEVYNRGEVARKLDTKANQKDLNQATDRITKNETAINGLTTKTTEISYADGEGTKISGVTIKDGNIVGNGNSAITQLANVGTDKINGKSLAGTTVATEKNVADAVKTETDARTAADTALEGKINDEKTAREAEDTNLSNRIGTVAEDGKYIKKSVTNNVSENLKVLDTQAKTNADNIQTNADNIKNNKDEIARVNGELVKTNDYFNTELSKTNDYFNTELGKTNTALQAEGQARANADAALANDIKATNKRTAGIGRTDTGVETDNQTVIEGNVHFDQKGNVSGVKDLKTDTIHATGEIKTTGKVSAGDVSTGTLETTGNAKIDGNLDVTGTLNIKDVTAETIHISKSEDTTDYKSEGSIIGEGGKLSVSNEKFNKRTNITEKSELNVNEKGTVNWATSKDNATGNVTEGRSEVTADNIKNSVMKTEGGKTFGYEENITEAGKVGTATDKDGNRNELTQTATGTENTVTSKDGNKSTTKQEAGSISSTVYDKAGNVKASSEMKEDGSISNNATGDMTNTVGGKLTTTVAGQATEEFNGGLNTTVTGTENHTVNGKQINTIKNGQENIISGGQTNTITGGQINNITGDQTTTITGNKTETVTENVTEDYQKDLTTTVGGNENHEVKGTKTETVEGKVTENYKAGQETNVTGDQDITVSGTQTTKATDINRNASSGMIDTIDNDYGTNTETKVAGKTTTDVSIKGTGEEGKYIRGANESRDYLIKGTLKNSETKTAEATSTEITDGNGKTSATIQDVNNLAGSVTNGTETGVSGIHANDNSVSIDSIVTDGNKCSVINQKKGSIQSTVVDGTNSTVILQDKDNVTIASSNGTVGIVGKDIVNNAQNTITNTAGTSITNQVNDSKVTTDANGTTFENNTPEVSDGGATTTKINGNQITTGKVTMDYAQVMKDLGVNCNANIGGKTTTGSLEVTGTSTLKGNVTMESNATVGGTLEVTGKATFHNDVDITGDVTAKSYKVGGKTYIDVNGIHANNQKITNVADGSISEGSKDAVNGGQLYSVKNDLEGKVNKVGANAAAMANLHPMEFDPDSKWNIAAAIGNYGSETAAALGAFYRPNDDVMVNLSTAFGTGENMVGGGVSVRLGKGGNKLSREESNALKAQVADLTARMDALLSVLNPNMSKDFPDVPENHWAYEAVSRLAGNDIVQGYPDGEFHGERTMTRYEMAEIIYNALSRGAEAEKELVEEFKPELQAMAASEKATAERVEG